MQKYKRDITILLHLAQAVSLEFSHVTLGPHSDIARQVFLHLDIENFMRFLY
jgi:hypothetical protein